MDMTSNLSQILEQLVIVKDVNGSAYLVEWDFNGIGDLEIGQGYQIKTTEEVPLEIVGDYTFPQDYPISLSAGWNMIGYLRTEPANASSVLFELNSQGNLIIVKDYLGAAYLPEWNFNGIGDMIPGRGYQLKTFNEGVLEYLENDLEYRLGDIEFTDNQVSHFERMVPTDNNMTMVIDDGSWDNLPQKGSEISAYDEFGKMVGSGSYTSPVTVLTVWGDDLMTSERDGLSASEEISFKLWDTEVIRDFTIPKWSQGSSYYHVDAVNVAYLVETGVESSIIDNTDFYLVKVINVLGQEVDMNTKSYSSEILFKVYSDGSVEKVIH